MRAHRRSVHQTPQRARLLLGAVTTARLNRRKVFVRDKFQCGVLGCRSCRHLEVRHIVRRADGGDHRLSNLLLLCDGHHTLLHDGILAIRGHAPDRLVFELPLGADDN